jgi:hypothetical protein
MTSTWPSSISPAPESASRCCAAAALLRAERTSEHCADGAPRSTEQPLSRRAGSRPSAAADRSRIPSCTSRADCRQGSRSLLMRRQPGPSGTPPELERKLNQPPRRPARVGAESSPGSWFLGRGVPNAWSAETALPRPAHQDLAGRLGPHKSLLPPSRRDTRPEFGPRLGGRLIHRAGRPSALGICEQTVFGADVGTGRSAS